MRAELGLKDELIIGHIGRFNKQKNHDFLIEIFKVVHQNNSDTVLLMIGDGDLRSSIEKKVENLGLSLHVRSLGIRSDISNLMQAMDIFLFPSLFEGLPVVLIEAQAAGLRCIVSNTITKESNVTGRVDYISLAQSPKYWAENILASTYEHADTSSDLQKYGYDSESMAQWLVNFYSNYYPSKQNNLKYLEVY